MSSRALTEQMNDGVELVIADCHLGGKIAFHEQRRLLVKRPRSAGERWSELVAAPASLLAPSLGSQAGLASTSGVDVIRPCHCIDRIPRPNPIP